MTDQIIKFIKVVILRLALNVIRRKKAAVVMVLYCNNFTARFTCLAIYFSKCCVLGTGQNLL